MYIYLEGSIFEPIEWSRSRQAAADKVQNLKRDNGTSLAWLELPCDFFFRFRKLHLTRLRNI